jgi:homoserine kinase
MNESNSVTVFAPATVANVGSAFDVLGFALESPGDTVTAAWSPLPGISISSISGSSILGSSISGTGIDLPTDPKRNTASVSIQALIDALPVAIKDILRLTTRGITLDIEKGLPIGSGLGSSSASTVAAVVAANELMGSPFSKEQLLPFAMEGERIACGAAHADNVGPALLGGFILVRSYSPLDIIPLPCPKSLHVALLSPDVEIKTSDARRILKQSVPLRDAITQWGNVAALIAGIFKDDPELIGRALEDKIIEPSRADLIPGFQTFKFAALTAGAHGFAISGSGPSVFAVCSSDAVASKVAEALKRACTEIGINGRTFHSRVNSKGASVIGKK